MMVKNKNSVSCNQNQTATRRLFEFSRNRFKLFVDQFNIEWIQDNETKKIMRLNSKEFKNNLSRIWFEHSGKPIQKNMRDSVLSLLSAYCDERIELHNRVAKKNNKFIYAILDENLSCIVINDSNWTYTKCEEPIFAKEEHQLPQVVPITNGGGHIDKLFEIFHMNKNDRYLCKVWLVTCFIPEIPHYVILIWGEKGSSKTMLARTTRKVIDPSLLETLTLPKDSKELIQMLSHNYYAVFDNVSRITEEQSDILCRATTGEAISKRALYTNDSDFFYKYRRCSGINGINPSVFKPDLLDRAITIELEPISKDDRKTEEELNAMINDLIPSVLGEIFSTISKAMQTYPKLKIRRFPRMADASKWGEAVSQAMDYPEGYFMNTLDLNSHKQTEKLLEGYLLVDLIKELLSEKEEFIGSATELYDGLCRLAGEKRNQLPKNSSNLSRKLIELKGSLLEIGICYNSNYVNKGYRKEVRLAKVKTQEPT